MRHPALIALAIFLVINFGCGRQMTEQQAVETLKSVPIESSGDGTIKTAMDPNAPASVQDLNALVQHLVDSGEVRLNSNTRAALTNSSSSSAKIDMSVLTQIISLLQSQNGKPSILEIVKILMANNPAGATGTKIDAIIALINQLAPIIAQIAPKFAPILSAIVTILPMVVAIINMFKKPSAAVAGFLPEAA